MVNSQNSELKDFLHSVSNPLNSITLHAELGKMLIDDKANVEEIKNAFTVILQQCRVCESEFAQMRKKINQTEQSKT